MNCREIRDVLIPYLHGEVSNAERVLIQAHLAQCARCRDTLADVSDLHGRLSLSLRSRASVAVPPARAWERLQAQLGSTSRTRTQPHWYQRLLSNLNIVARSLFGSLWRATAASALMAVLIGGAVVTLAPTWRDSSTAALQSMPRVDTARNSGGAHAAANSRLSAEGVAMRYGRVADTPDPEGGLLLVDIRVSQSAFERSFKPSGYLVSGRWVSE